MEDLSVLILTRKPNESVLIGDGIEIVVVAIRRGSVRLGIIAPKEIRVARDDLKPIPGTHRETEE
jgi:carbon storage regulator